MSSKIKQGWESLTPPLKAHITLYGVFLVLALLVCSALLALNSTPVSLALFTGVASFCLIKSYFDFFY